MGIGRSILTPAEAQRALYVDFEGNKDRDPTLLGALVDVQGPEFWIVEEAFAVRTSTEPGPSRRRSPSSRWSWSNERSVRTDSSSRGASTTTAFCTRRCRAIGTGSDSTASTGMRSSRPCGGGRHANRSLILTTTPSRRMPGFSPGRSPERSGAAPLDPH